MKTIMKSVFLTAILALVVTGCQKDNDDLNVSLKSAPVDFDGGIYYYDWTSGDAEAECALAGGCEGGSLKFDSGVDLGINFNEGGVTVTGISKQAFSWTSEYPVCKIIVKAGKGAYVFHIGGLKSGTVPYPSDLGVKEKDISHITFCFGPPPPPDPVILTIKSWYWETYDNNTWIGTGSNYAMIEGEGILYPFDIGDWCDPLGVVTMAATTELLHLSNNVGSVKIEEGWPDGIHSWVITVDLNEGMVFQSTSLYVGTLSGLVSTGTCPDYRNWPYQNGSRVNTHIFTIPI